MYFVGHEKETKQIIKALRRGDNIVLTGKYGIGRTSLIKYIADTNRNRWRFIFVDFSQTPGKVCQNLMAEFAPERKGLKRDKGPGYKSSRFRIANLDFRGQKQPVLVMDNIGKLTSPKLDLIRYLAMTKRFRFVAVVENFLTAEKLSVFRAWLYPVLLLKVPYLGEQKAREFFRHFSGKHHFFWTEEEINNLAEMSGGYPLGMKEIVTRKLTDSRSWEVPAILSKTSSPGAGNRVGGQKAT